MVLLATVPPPAVNSATYYAAYDSSSYSSSVGSVAAAGQDGSYEQAVSKYEPWAAEEDAAADCVADADDASRFDMRTHMMMAQ
jgi:hypothetical protein